jgi:hypothetical protein
VVSVDCEGETGTHCEIRGLASELVEMKADPENGHDVASALPQTIVPSPLVIVQLDRSVSNPGFLIRFPALGCGHVQLAPVLQHLPPHAPLAHSVLPPQTTPADFFATHEVPLQ